MTRTQIRSNDPDLERGRASEPLARATALYQVSLDSARLEASSRFLEDFGLVPLARTAHTLAMGLADVASPLVVLRKAARARLSTIALSVQSELELRRLASLPEAVPGALSHPEGVRCVRLVAPGGLVFEAVLQREQVDPPARPAVRPHNASHQLARIGAGVRVAASPSRLLRLGHVALETPQPLALTRWLMRTFGMLVSDYQPLDEKPGALPITSFLRCDLGLVPADHHTLAVALSPLAQVSHVAFEVTDVDELGRGAAHLKAQGHRHSWGLGRHILGSQLFDYWRSPEGIAFEHYCDGDVLDAAASPGRLPFRGSNLAQWGGPPPAGLALHAPRAGSLGEAARALFASDASPVTFARAFRALLR